VLAHSSLQIYPQDCLQQKILATHTKLNHHLCGGLVISWISMVPLDPKSNGWISCLDQKLIVFRDLFFWVCMYTLDLAFLSAKFSARVPYLMSGTLDASTLSALPCHTCLQFIFAIIIGLIWLNFLLKISNMVHSHLMLSQG